MNKNTILFWLPRALSILIVGFFYLFVLEGFSPEFSWQDSLVHFVLATIVLFFAILAWKKPKIGGWIFIIIGLYFLITTVTKEVWWISFPVIIPLLLMGTLFLIGGSKKSKITSVE